jgi:hypothetical protein
MACVFLDACFHHVNNSYRSLLKKGMKSTSRKYLSILVNKVFIIYLPRVLCLSPCRLVIFLSSCRPVCHCCGTLSYSLSFSNQTDQGDETEGLEREGLEMGR